MIILDLFISIKCVWFIVFQYKKMHHISIVGIMKEIQCNKVQILTIFIAFTLIDAVKTQGSFNKGKYKNRTSYIIN